MTIFHGGNRRAAAERFGCAPGDFIDFSANINFHPLPAAYQAALQAALPAIQNYPDPEYRRLYAALTDWLGVSTDSLVLGNGTAELIPALLRALAPGRIVVIEPAFTEYAQAARVAGLPVVPCPLSHEENFPLLPDRLAELLAAGDLVFLGHPNNPTSLLYPRDTVAKLLALCRAANATLVLDEAFIDFVDDRGASFVPNAATGGGPVVLRALTKFFACPGLRVGALVATPSLAARLRALLPPWNINCLAEAVLPVLLADAAWQQAARSAGSAARRELAAALAAAPLAITCPPAANFIMVRLAPGHGEAAALDEFLGRRGMLIRTCADFPGLTPGHFRVAVRSPADNRALLGALGEYFHV